MLSFERHRKEFSRTEPQAEGSHALIKVCYMIYRFYYYVIDHYHSVIHPAHQSVVL